MNRKVGWILFDWGGTLMRVLPGMRGAMKDWPRVEALPGTAQTLAALAPRWGLALATNAADSSGPEIRQALARVGLDRLMERIYCTRDLGERKPFPGFYRAILDDLGVPAGQVIMVGDDFELDVQAANACGIRAVWLNTVDRSSRSGEDHRTIHALEELPGALAEWHTAAPDPSSGQD